MKFTEAQLEQGYTMVNDQFLMVNDRNQPALIINHYKEGELEKEGTLLKFGISEFQQKVINE